MEELFVLFVLVFVAIIGESVFKSLTSFRFFDDIIKVIECDKTVVSDQTYILYLYCTVTVGNLISI